MHIGPRSIQTHAESIPYFDFSEFEKHKQNLLEAQLDSWIMVCMPGGAKNDGVFGFFYACLASFAKHHEWYESTIHTQTDVALLVQANALFGPCDKLFPLEKDQGHTR